MKPIPTFLIAMAMTVLTAPSLYAMDNKRGGIAVIDPWARASFGTARPAAAYVTIRNDGAHGDALLSVSSPVAGRVEIHESKMENGVMKMSPVELLNVPAGHTVTLKPGGYHIMLMKLNKALEEDDTFPLSLTFRNAGTIEVDVHVKKPGAMGSGHSDMSGHGGQMDDRMGEQMPGMQGMHGQH